MTTYSIESVVEGIGYLRATEEHALHSVLGHGATIRLDQDTHQVHLCWELDADSLDDAVRTSHNTLRDAVYATGVYCPDTSLFTVRKINQ